MSGCEILAIAVGSVTVIFLSFWFVMLIWQAFFPEKKVSEENLMTRIKEWFGELALGLLELLT